MGRVSLCRCSLVLLIVFLAGHLMIVSADEPAQPMIGEGAPLFTLSPARGGDPVSLEKLRGRYVVIHFGTSW